MNLARQQSDPRLAQLTRILASESFNGPGRIQRFLRFVVEETVAGHENQIKEYSIGLSVYDKPASFDPKIDSTVRSEATKLRARLTAYYEREGATDPVVITIPRGTYVPSFETRKVVAMPEPAPTPAPLAVERTPRRWKPAAILAVLGAAGTATWWYWRPAPVPPQSQLVKLTSDLALNTTPVFSRDGRLVVYSSTRGGNGSLDLWIQQVPLSGEAQRLTGTPENESDPDLSPDGRWIAFRSERDGGGVYLMPVEGGQARLFASEGRFPRFSPDGRWLAYQVGDEMLAATAVTGGAEIRIGAVEGGTHRRVAADLSVATSPLWFADSQRLLLDGYQGQEPAGVRMDWWVAYLDGRPSTNAGMKAVLGKTASCVKWRTPPPAAWSGENVIAAGTCDGRDLWSIPFSVKSGQVAGPPVRLTVSSELVVSPRTDSSGQIVYASTASNSALWSVSLDGKAALTRLTETSGQEQFPSISADGRWLAFVSARFGNQDIWVKDLTSGRERILVAGPDLQTYPVMDPAGTSVTWTQLIPDPKDVVGINHAAWRTPVTGGPAAKVCEHCAEMGPGPDGRGHLDLDGRPTQIVLRDAQGAYKPYLSHPRRDLMMAVPSPDRRWLAFQVRHEDDRLHLYTVPFAYPAPAASAWTHWGEGQMPVWEAGGSTLYFLSNRDGHPSLWGQRIQDGRPAGDPFPLLHVRGMARRIVANSPVFRWMSASRTHMFLPIEERTGNIWVLRASK